MYESQVNRVQEIDTFFHKLASVNIPMESVLQRLADLVK